MHQNFCLLYTSDAADEEDSVDLGGRRIIKNNTNTKLVKYNLFIFDWKHVNLFEILALVDFSGRGLFFHT